MYKSKDFTELRNWTMPHDSNITIDDIKTTFGEVARAADISVYISDIEIDNNIPAFEISSLYNSNYMGVYVYYYSNFVSMALEGKGEQIKAPELETLFQKAAGSVLGVYNAYKYSKNKAMRFGISGTTAGIGAGLGAITGGVVRGSAKLIVKGVKALLRDQEAYDKELAFYQLVLGLGDYLVGASDTSNIISKLRSRAEAGDENAQYWMGSAYVEGRGVQTDLDEAVRWFALAAAQDEKRSKEILAVEYLYGEKEYTVEEKHTGLKYMREMADAGDEDAAINIIDIYGFKSVNGIAADLSKMIEVAEVYADRGNTYAIIVLARTYDTLSTNEAVSDASYKDDKKAARWYESILILDDQEYKEEASMCLANMYVEGRGVAKDPEKGVKYLEIAAQCGNMEAKAVLAYYLTLGIGADKDYATAQRLCKEVIQRGNPNERTIAYYCSYRIFDEAKKYKQSMEYARKFLESGNIDVDKKDELERYLAEKEEAISKMTDEERREYLQERKPIFNFKSKEKKEGTNRKPLIIIGIIALVLVVIVGAFKINSNNNKEVNNTGTLHTDKSITSSTMWTNYEQYNFIGKDYETVSNTYGNDFEWIGDAGYCTIWQHFTELGVYDIAELHKIKGSEITFAFALYDEIWLCDVIGGTAEELFGLEEAIDIDTFMNNLGVYIGDQNRYALSCTTDIADNNWWAFKANVANVNINGDDFVYIIKVYAEGLDGVYSNEMEEIPLVNSSTIGDYYEGYGDDYDIVYPETKVTVSLVPYGVGLD